jgi:hypothetical protein
VVNLGRNGLGGRPPQGVVRALLVVFEQPLLGDVLDLFDGGEQVGVKHLVPVRPV